MGAPQSADSAIYDLRLTRAHFSCKVYRSYLTYLKKNYPRIDLEKLCRDAGLSLSYLEDENNFVSTIFDEKFTRLCIERTGETDFCYRVGAQTMSAEVLGQVVHFLVTKTFSARMIYNQLPRLTEIFSKVTRLKFIREDAGALDLQLYAVTSEMNDEEKASLRNNFENIFQNTVGHYVAIPTAQGLPPAHLDFTKLDDKDGFPIYEIHLRYEVSNPLMKALYLITPLAVSISFAAVINILFGYSSAILISVCLIAAAAWMVTGRYYFNELKKRFDQAIRGIQNADQRYTSLVQAQEQLKRLSDSYKKFVPWEFIELLNLKSINEIELGQSVEREMTVMFLDIRGFTKLSENMDSKENLNLLNSFLAAIAPAIREHHGFIDKYVGDGIMAIFPKSAKDAVEGAVNIVRRLNKFNETRAISNQAPIRIGMGLNTGTITLGTIGYMHQMQNTAISDAVNVASRLESATKDFDAQILVSEETLNLSGLRDRVRCRPLGHIALDGRAQPVSVYEIYEGKENLDFQRFDDSRLDFEYAVKLYEAKRYDEASKIFEGFLLRNPNDRAAERFLNLIKNAGISTRASPRG